MKNIFAFVCLSFIVLITACHKKDSSGPTGTLEVNRTAINLDTTVGSTGSLIVRSTLSWTATLSSGASWLKLSKTSGGAGDSVLTLTVLSNNGTATSQTATITFSAGSDQVLPVTVTVTQKIIALSWQKALGGSLDDIGYVVAKTSDGGTIVAGTTKSTDGDVSSNQGNRDIFVVKMDASGNKQWSKTFGGTNYDYAIGIVATTDGGYALCGLTYSSDGDISSNRGSSDILVIKIDASGNKQWLKTFGGTSSEIAYSILTTTDGGYVLAGETRSKDGDISSNQGNYDLLAMKLDASGNKVWTTTFGGTEDDIGCSITATANGGFAIAGYTNSTDGDISSNQGDNDILVVKLDASGNKQWVKTFGGSSDDIGTSIITTADGGYALAGEAESTDGDISNNHGSQDLLVIKLDAAGSKQWAKTFGGSGYDASPSIIGTVDGGFVLAGSTTSNDGDVTGNHGDNDVLALKLNSSGSKEWAKTFGGTGYDEGLFITSTTDGGYAVTGRTNSTDGDVSGNHGGYDMWVLKLDF